MKLYDNDRYKNEGSKNQSQTVDEEFPQPLLMLGAEAPPMAHHSQLGKGEGDENIDTVKYHKESNRSLRQKHSDAGSAAHEQNAVLSYETIAQHREPSWKPAIESHVCQNPRSVQ